MFSSDCLARREVKENLPTLQPLLFRTEGTEQEGGLSAESFPLRTSGCCSGGGASIDVWRAGFCGACGAWNRGPVLKWTQSKIQSGVHMCKPVTFEEKSREGEQLTGTPKYSRAILFGLNVNVLHDTSSCRITPGFHCVCVHEGVFGGTG